MTEGVTQPEAELVIIAEESTGEIEGRRGKDWALVRLGERGMVSAEWAVGIIAAVAVAGVLLAVVTTGAVKDALLKVVLTIIRNFV